jgi:hypothetical protein
MAQGDNRAYVNWAGSAWAERRLPGDSRLCYMRKDMMRKDLRDRRVISAD